MSDKGFQLLVMFAVFGVVIALPGQSLAQGQMETSLSDRSRLMELHIDKQANPRAGRLSVACGANPDSYSPAEVPPTPSEEAGIAYLLTGSTETDGTVFVFGTDKGSNRINWVYKSIDGGVSWTAVSPGPLPGNPAPPGLMLDKATGVLSGIPTTPGIFPSTVVSLDSNFCKLSAIYSLIANPAGCPAITLPPDDLPAGEEGTFYSQSVAATGSIQVQIPTQATPMADGGRQPDDIEEDRFDGRIRINSSDIDIGVDIIGGFYFRDVNVPAGAIIQTATLDFMADGDHNDAAVLLIRGELAANSVPFVPDGTPDTGPFPTSDYDLTSRTYGTEVSWTPGVWFSRDRYVSPNLKAIVQEIIDVPGWASGNRMLFKVDLEDPTTTFRGVYAAEASVGRGAILRITYSCPAGTECYIYSVTAGVLPPGLALDPDTGIISGTPDTPGIYQFTISAIDATFCVGSQDYTIIINPVGCPNIVISPDVLPNASSGTLYEETLTADGGEAPYTWVISAGALPDGIVLDPDTGIVYGYPAADDVFSFAVTTQDANGCYGTQTYGVEVVCTLDVTITSPPEITGSVLACNSIFAEGVQVVAPGATFVAGSFIVLGDGFSVGPEAGFTAIIDPSLLP